MPWWNPFQKTREQSAPRRPGSEELEGRLLRDRIIMLGTPIDDDVATQVVAKLRFLESESPTKDINLYLNSPGGSVTAALAICDTLEHVKPDVSTICVRQCSGIAALIFALGERGKRFALTKSHFQLVPFEGGQRPEAQADIERLRQDFTRRLAQATGQTVSQVLADCEANRRLSALEARSYGLVDEIVERAT